MNTRRRTTVSLLLGTIIYFGAFFLIDINTPVHSSNGTVPANTTFASTASSYTDNITAADNKSIYNTTIPDTSICDTSIYDITTSNVSISNASISDDTSLVTNINDTHTISTDDTSSNTTDDTGSVTNINDTQTSSTDDTTSSRNEENDDSASSNDSSNPESYNSLSELVDDIKNKVVDNDEIPLDDFKNTGAYQGADEQTQDCIDLAAKIGSNLIDYEIVRCSEDQNFFKNQIANNNDDNSD